MLEESLRKIDLNLLVVLRSLLVTSSVGQTAKILGISQPAASRALASLRKIFGDRLFVKSGSKMIATPRALALRAPLENALSGVLQVVEPATTFDPGTSWRRFRIATTDYGATVVLPPLVERFFVAAPNAKLEFTALTSKSFEELGSDDLDLVLYSDNPVPPAMRFKELFRERFACLVRRKHPALEHGNKSLSLEGYLAYSHMLVSVEGGRHGPVDRELAALGRERNIALTLPYFGVAALAAANSDLILTMPRRAATAFAKTAPLELMTPPVQLEEFGYRLVWHERVHDDTGHVWLRRMIGDMFRSEIRPTHG